MKAVESGIDATKWPLPSDEPAKLLTWRCVLGLALFQFVSTLLLADAAEQGMTELARVVTAGSMPAFAVWALRNSDGACQTSRA